MFLVEYTQTVVSLFGKQKAPKLCVGMLFFLLPHWHWKHMNALYIYYTYQIVSLLRNLHTFCFPWAYLYFKTPNHERAFYLEFNFPPADEKYDYLGQI